MPGKARSPRALRGRREQACGEHESLLHHRAVSVVRDDSWTQRRKGTQRRQEQLEFLCDLCVPLRLCVHEIQISLHGKLTCPRKRARRERCAGVASRLAVNTSLFFIIGLSPLFGMILGRKGAKERKDAKNNLNSFATFASLCAFAFMKFKSACTASSHARESALAASAARASRAGLR